MSKPATVVASALVGALATANAMEAPTPLQPVPFTQVQLSDPFWAPRQEVNRKVTLIFSLDQLEKAGNIKNLDLVIEGKHEGYSGPVFMDSDLYKAIEACAYSLATHPDPALSKRLDDIIAKIATAQMPDGYLNTHYQVNEPDKRWTNLRDNHELYCAGHLIEAAVAHWQATGKRTLLDVATKFADHIDSTFGEGKRMGYPGHPELELALFKLYRATQEKRYFDLAKFFVDSRGRQFFATEHKTPLERFRGDYWQDEKPIREMDTMVGHAVRCAYLLSGATDVLSGSWDESLSQALQRIWKSTTRKRMFITGGIGPSASNEGFTTDFDLPTFSAYQETCASIALAQWAHRMALLYGDASYMDVAERALYNGIADGVSLDGQSFFYGNPLASLGHVQRSAWFGCACCPPNVARTIAAIGSYAYATSEDGLYVNLYIDGSANVQVGETKFNVDVETSYPWQGRVTMTLGEGASGKWKLNLRIPDWCKGYLVMVNSTVIRDSKQDKGYEVLDRDWKAGDQIELRMEMPVRQVQADPRSTELAGRLALMRGPIVYALEGKDHDVSVHQIAIPVETYLVARWREELLGGVMVIEGAGLVGPKAWEGGLYEDSPTPKKVKVVAIPYCVWANRGPSPMAVWVPEAPATPRAGGPEVGAEVTLSHMGTRVSPEGANDGILPKKSSDQPTHNCHFWPKKGGEVFVEYRWDEPVSVNRGRVFFFDDTGRGECKVPKSWRMEYLDGDGWHPLPGTPDYKVAIDAWCEVGFDTVSTKGMRLVMEQQEGWSSGVHEWQLVGPED